MPGSKVVLKCAADFAPSSGFLWMIDTLITWKPEVRGNGEGAKGNLWLVDHT